VKYNNARVTKVITAMLFPKKAPILREGTLRIFQHRKKANKEGNESLANALKLLLNSLYGKTVTRKHYDRMVVKGEEENEEIEKIYLSNRGVTTYVVLANGKQCLIDYVRRRRPSVIDPVHINSYILSYIKEIMHNFLLGFDGFTDWEKTPYYSRQTQTLTTSIANNLKN
jgi:hypothetical protein